MKIRVDDVEANCKRLRDVLRQTSGLGRREFLVALRQVFAGSAVLSLLPGMSVSVQAAEQPVTAFVFGGDWKKSAIKAFGEPFTQKTGIPMAYQDPYTFAKLQAMHDSGVMQVDVASVEGAEIRRANSMKMIMPLDFDVIDRSQLDPRQLRFGDAIGGHMLSSVIVYNKKKWPGENHPKSWADFWDVDKFPGRRVLRRDLLYYTVDAALKADGAKEEGFYPLDVDRAFRSLDRIKPHIKAWYSDNSLAQQMMEQEEVDLIAMVNGRASQSIIDNKAPFEIVWNEAICEGGNEGWVALAGCPNPKGAMKFLDLVGRPEYQATFARLTYYSPQNSKAFDYIDPELAKILPSYPDNLKVAHIVNSEWWAQHLPEVQRRFEIWLQS
jgi:putative spermidine/putrescine transport system substrate-binding protein